MKFMKLGSKPDALQTEGNNTRYVATELPSDIVVNVGCVKFYLHKFPLLSKSVRLQKLVTAATTEENGDEVDISDIPGGPSAFEICAKFCYGMIVTLNAYNVFGARCAAEYLGMDEIVEKGNLIYKIDVFLNSSVFRRWKDSIIVLQTSKVILPFLEEHKLVKNCIDSITTKACVHVSKVDWSYTYNRKKLVEEKVCDPNWNGVRNQSVPKDWWVEDLCELEIDLYKQVVTNIKAKSSLFNVVVGESLKAYAYRWLPGLNKGVIKRGDVDKYRSVLDSIVWLLPVEKGCVSCSFLLKLLKAAICVDCDYMCKKELVRRIGQQLEEASVSDLLIRAMEGETTVYDVRTVQKLVEEFTLQDRHDEIEILEEDHGCEGRIKSGILSDASKLMVAKLIDGYLAEIAKDPNLPLSMFVELAESVSNISRPSHDGLYLAIDMFLKEHNGISKTERKKICKLMDCKKLSVDACVHAVQNERLPLRVVVQVLFFEQVRATKSSGSSTPDLPKGIKDLNSGSLGSSRSATTNTEEEWDIPATAEELRALKGELASLRLANEAGNGDRVGGKGGIDKAAVHKMKGLIKSRKIFAKLWPSRGGSGDNSSSDSSESPGSANPEEAKSTPSGNRRHSVS